MPLSRMICLSNALLLSGVPISDCCILTFWEEKPYSMPLAGKRSGKNFADMMMELVNCEVFEKYLEGFKVE